MTDKELARESWWNDNNCSGALPTEKIYECGFLAGVEAGRPKWHKVADGDLPPEDSEVLALLADKEIYMAHFYRRNVWDKIGPVIAWCEIPKYSEE